MRIILESIVAIVFLSGLTVDACTLDRSSSWYWTKDTLIEKTPDIVIAVAKKRFRSVDKITDRDRPYDYEFEVIEALKGKLKNPLILRGFGDENSGVPNSTEPHGRAFYNSSCKAVVGFAIGKRYIIFKDSAHAWGYQELDGPNGSDWIEKIKAELKKFD